ncbi:MAG: hypothetical protein R3E12_20205 [Candidatus Eisenbacteria bacterium]
MISQALKELSTPLFRTQWALWAAFATTPVTVLVLGFLLADRAPERTIAGEWALVGIGILAATLAYVRLRRVGTEERIRSYMQPSSEVPLEAMATAPRTSVVDQGLLAKLRALSEPDLRYYRALMQYQKDLIIGLALAEVVPMAGLVHCAVTGRFPVLVPYVMIGIILHLAGRPRGEMVLNRAEGMQYLG